MLVFYVKVHSKVSLCLSASKYPKRIVNNTCIYCLFFKGCLGTLEMDNKTNLNQSNIKHKELFYTAPEN